MPNDEPATPAAVDVAPARTKGRPGRPRAAFDEALAVAQYTEGYSVGALAKSHKISISTVMAALTRAGITCRGPRYRQPKSLPPLEDGLATKSD